MEALVGLYRSVLPQDMASINRADGTDDAYILAEMMAVSECVVKNWSRMGVVSHADGAYLELQARQTGLNKQFGESDDALRTRIQSPPFAITPDLILEAIQLIIDGSTGGVVRMIELPRDGAYSSRSFFLRRGARMGSSVVIVLIPEISDRLSAASDALRAKRAGAKDYLVQEYII